MRLELSLAALLLLPTLACADVAPIDSGQSPEQRFTYRYQNDLFTGTDRYFTQGQEISWVSPLLARSPLAIPLPSLEDGSRYEASLEWRYLGFTNDQISDPNVRINDRPFSAYLLLGQRSVMRGPTRNYALWAEWGVGYIGPGAGGRQFQTELHRTVGGRTPRGWRNQLDDDVLLQLEVGYAHRLLRWSEHLELEASAALRGGTLHTNIALGLELRLGFLGPVPSPEEPEPEALRAYLWARGGGRVVGYDATLQGGVFSDSVYTLRASQVERGVGTASAGWVVQLGRLRLFGSFTAITREFRRGKSHAWGELGFSVFFG